MYKKIFYKNYYTRSNNKKGLEYRCNLFKDKENIHKSSFWHDLDYKNYSDNTFNMVMEVPRGESAKFEMSMETFNPIKQDIKINKFTNKEYLRYYKLIPDFNYGFIPRTWENNKIQSLGGYFGDNDPLDIVELSRDKRFYVGQIIKAYVVGSFCLIDEGEIDWKILAVDSELFTREESLNFMSIPNNLEKIKQIQEWFKIYKTFEGKKKNIIYDNDKIFDVEETKKIIEENNQSYMDLISGKI